MELGRAHYSGSTIQTAWDGSGVVYYDAIGCFLTCGNAVPDAAAKNDPWCRVLTPANLQGTITIRPGLTATRILYSDYSISVRVQNCVKYVRTQERVALEEGYNASLQTFVGFDRLD